MSVEAHLEIDPPNTLEFSLSREESTPNIVLLLKHPDAENNTPIAFKVKTTQPRRYLVRPNQGLIAPGAVEKISILIVEKDKNQLLSQYESLGAAALDTCKDKFLVQSVAVTTEQAKNLTEYEQLTELWSQIQMGNSPIKAMAMANKKLHVRHKVTGSTTAGNAAPATALAIVNPERLSKEQLLVELQNLRKKYDELVGFSVNLTAERDVLNNSLEQTRRDLNRELSANAGGHNKSRATVTATHATAGGGPPMVTVLIYVVTALLLGAKLQQMGYLRGLPGFTSNPMYEEL